MFVVLWVNYDPYVNTDCFMHHLRASYHYFFYKYGQSFFLQTLGLYKFGTGVWNQVWA